MGLGECANFTAYAFAPASLVTPLGALSVLVSSVLASRCLNERVNLLGKIGCMLCLLGSTIIVIHSPKDEGTATFNDLIVNLHQPAFLLYVVFVLCTIMSIIFHFGPKYGKQNVLVYVILCSVVGSVTVIACKGLGFALKAKFSLENDYFLKKEDSFGNDYFKADGFSKEDDLLMDDEIGWSVQFFALTVFVCILVQMNYLNKTLDLFNTSIVTPIYYVFFTSFVILASSIVFNEWSGLKVVDLVGSVCGFFVVIIAVFLLNGFKELDVGFRDVFGLVRANQEVLRRDKYSCENLLARTA